MTTFIPTQEGEAGSIRLLHAQLDVLADVASGVPLGEALAGLLQVVEATSADRVLVSVLLLDEDGAHLRHCAAPSLPADYNAAIDGIAIGPAVGSCGTAAYTRRQVIVSDVQTDPLWAEFRDLAGAAGLRACWSTPIIGGDDALLGTFAMYYPQPQIPSADDIALIDVLVRTVTVAIERSRADEQRDIELAAERTAALTLQHSLLPAVPPHIGPVRLEARYRTGDPGVEVGGDWFDAIEVEGGCVVVVGDVQGHDLAAAALMGQLRTVVRAYAAEEQPPASILAGVARYLSRLGVELLATAVVVHLDPVARVATVASAGHLAPLMLTPTDAGGWSAVETQCQVGPPLGIGEEWPERTTVVPDGAVLLLYTDGLVETRTWPIEQGLTLLRTALETLPGDADLSRVLDMSLQVLPPGMRGDDVAVLAATTLPGSGSDNGGASRWLPAMPMSAPLARSWARGVLRGWSVPESTAEDAALVVSELVTNAARHSEEQLRVELSLDSADDAAPGVLVEVFDRSHRLPRMDDISADATAGRGLHIVASLAGDWGVREEIAGKIVWARLTFE